MVKNYNHIRVLWLRGLWHDFVCTFHWAVQAHFLYFALALAAI